MPRKHPIKPRPRDTQREFAGFNPMHDDTIASGKSFVGINHDSQVFFVFFISVTPDCCYGYRNSRSDRSASSHRECAGLPASPLGLTERGSGLNV